MLTLKVVDSHKESGFSPLRRQDALERGRADALDLLVQGKPLHDVISQLIFSIEDATPGLKCGFMLVNKEFNTLNTFVGPSLPRAFLATLDNLPIEANQACCGATAYTQKPTVAENIAVHPNWIDFVHEAETAGLKACWSYPVIAPDGELFGSLSWYFSEPKSPDQDDFDSMKYEAKIIAIILERAQNIEHLRAANQKLEQRVAERTKDLTDANLMLKKALEQRNEVQSQLVEMENMAALGTMMSSLTHEINTPVGVAITAVSHLRNIQEEILHSFENDSLKRSELQQYFNEALESADIIERNLSRSTELIKTFKQLSVDQHSQDARVINLCGYIDEVLLSLKPRLKRTKHKFCINVDPNLEFVSNPGAISQLLINLIMNSAHHAFDENTVGHIFITANLLEKSRQKTLQLVYKDNGKGMNQHTMENIYKPFFTMARKTGGSGLGMHICYNLVVKILGGRIDCDSKIGKGVTFSIQIPVE